MRSWWEYDCLMPKLTITNHDAVRFGAILRRLRVTRGWTIVTAARRCDMNPNYLGALEKGGNMISVWTLLDVAEVYGVNASDIVGEVEELRRAARKEHAAAVAANMPPIE